MDKMISPTHATALFADDDEVLNLVMETGGHSANRPADIPESVRWGGCPAFVFFHHALADPTGEPIPQLRPDTPWVDPNEPSAKAKKYIQASGTGAIISITQRMWSQVQRDTSRAFTVVICEGSKQALFAAAHANDAVIVVGIQGCFGWSQERSIRDELANLCGGRRVVAIFDADVSSNRNVYEAAGRLHKALRGREATPKAKDLKFAQIPVEDTDGLDDYLRRIEPRERKNVMFDIVANAVPFSSIPRPARERRLASDSEIYIVKELCVIGKVERESTDAEEQAVDFRPTAGVDAQGHKFRLAEVWMDAAVYVTAKVIEVDDLIDSGGRVSDDLTTDRVDLEVVYLRGADGALQRHTISGVPSKELNTPRMWLSRLQEFGMEISLFSYASTQAAQFQIGEALRRDMRESRPPTRIALHRSGYFIDNDERLVYADTGGSHMADGSKSNHVKSVLKGQAAAINIPAYDNFTDEDRKLAARQILAILDHTGESGAAAFMVLLSGLMYASAGGEPAGAAFMTGEPGAGKSTIAAAVMSAIGPWAVKKRNIPTIDGTLAAIGEFLDGVHHSGLLIDDAREQAGAKAQENQDQVLDTLIRIAYGGGEAGRQKKIKDASGDWITPRDRNNKPFCGFMGEGIPQSTPLSSIQRLLVVNVEKKTSLLPARDTPSGKSGEQYLMEISQTGALKVLMSTMIHRRLEVYGRALASSHGDGIEWGLQNITEAMGSYRDKIIARFPQLATFDPRARMVTGTFLAGLSITAATLSRMLGADELVDFEQSMSTAIIMHAVRHQSHVNEIEPGPALIKMAAAAIAAGEVNFDEVGEHRENKDFLGRMVQIQNDVGHCYALNTKVLSKMAGRKIDEKPFGDLAVQRKVLSQRIGLNQSHAPCICIREADWERITRPLNLDDEYVAAADNDEVF